MMAYEQTEMLNKTMYSIIVAILFTISFIDISLKLQQTDIDMLFQV